MTPEQAQEMLDRVKEGCPLPWEIFTTETIEGDPREVKNVRCNDPRYDGHLAYSADYEGTTEIDPDAIELVAAAPALAELVANLRYEYAVRVPNGKWVRETDKGKLTLTIDPMRALRHYHPRIIKHLADMASEYFGCECRVMRRLVSEPEVAE